MYVFVCVCVCNVRTFMDIHACMPLYKIHTYVRTYLLGNHCSTVKLQKATGVSYAHLMQ